jgi:E1A-binding protein p400
MYWCFSHFDSFIYRQDWNPAMDNQAQDRCHRIGQTREVHIYRLISEATIEENILKKANQKRQLDAVVIGDGKFTTDQLRSMDGGGNGSLMCSMFLVL